MSMSHGSTHQMKFELRSAADVTNPTDGEAWRAIPAAQRGQMLCLSRRLDEKRWQTCKKASGGQFSFQVRKSWMWLAGMPRERI